MILEILKWAVLSLILIILVHYLYIFFKNNLTIPKTKDLITKPIENYNKMDNLIINNKNDKKYNNDKNDTTLIENLNDISSLNSNNFSNLNINNMNNMKNELKSFFKELNDI